eukprot:3153768-Rhodomonas_salina.3
MRGPLHPESRGTRVEPFSDFAAHCQVRIPSRYPGSPSSQSGAAKQCKSRSLKRCKRVTTVI